MNDCADHLSICQAECCKEFTLRDYPFKKELVKGMIIRFYKACNKQGIRYYKLHGCNYAHGTISFALKEWAIRGKDLIIKNVCEGLTDDLQCKYHGTNKQPTMCQKPNAKEHDNLIDIDIVPKCKYYEVKK